MHVISILHLYQINQHVCNLNFMKLRKQSKESKSLAALLFRICGEKLLVTCLRFSSNKKDHHVCYFYTSKEHGRFTKQFICCVDEKVAWFMHTYITFFYAYKNKYTSTCIVRFMESLQNAYIMNVARTKWNRKIFIFIA